MARKKSAGKREVPVWDGVGHRLYFRGELIKRYRRPAPLHWLILSAFQEDGWPEFIDDPLPPDPNLRQHPHERLRDVVRGVNRSLNGSGIHFECNGDECLRWSAT